MLISTALLLCIAAPEPQAGYYRFPAVHGSTVVFTAEGDLWKTSLDGGVATRLTTHLGQETNAAISPDGNLVAFSGRYEGTSEVYVMPLAGGVPQRLTFEGDRRAAVVGFTPAGRVMYRTRAYAGLPSGQLVTIDPTSGDAELLPLAQASDGSYDPKSGTLFFTRLEKQSSKTKRYKGGTAENLWAFTPAVGGAKAKEAVALTPDDAGTNKNPRFNGGRIYFLSDRSGSMNVWSMAPTGKGLKQHTNHVHWEAKSLSVQGDAAVYQLGADLMTLNLRSGKGRKVDVRLASDFEQRRERWVSKPLDYLTTAFPSPDGKRVVLTARGDIFVAPVKPGRLVQVTDRPDVNYRAARFAPDGKSLIALSDESGEMEWWRLDPFGISAPAKITTSEPAFIREGAISPDGRWLAYADRDRRLWLFDTKKKSRKKIDQSVFAGQFTDLVWSADSRWLAYTISGSNLFPRIHLYFAPNGRRQAITSDRVESYNPAFSPDGKWMYFLSERRLRTVVPSPWGSRQPEPFLDKAVQVFILPLRPGEVSPFDPPNELTKAPDKEKDDKKGEDEKPKDPAPVQIDLGGIQDRAILTPIPPGNYSRLSVSDEHVFVLQRKVPTDPKRDLLSFAISNEPVETKTVLKGIKDYDLTDDKKNLLVVRDKDLLVIPAAPKPPKKLDKHTVRISDWKFTVDPKREWRQMLVEAWRLERDFFYDPGMHGVRWKEILARHLAVIDRVTDRAELSDLISEMVGELSALHIFVFGGDQRRGSDKIHPGSLGAQTVREERAGGHRIKHIYATDFDFPNERPPLARSGVDAREGDVVTAIDGRPTLVHADLRALLRNKAGKQVRLTIARGKKSHDVIVKPISPREDAHLRYLEWEYTRRLRVEEKSKGQIGYVHLRAMGGANFSEWARHFYPVFDRPGLIIDVRNNRGGNIDSWILSRLMRKAWFYWKPRKGKALANMQYAYRGHMITMVNEHTASDGEAFAEGFRRLGLGKVLGTRTWGGEIWLSFDNFLVDKGIATAAQTGVFSPQGEWLIEGHGVDPDIVVDNLPHATFAGQDLQLDRAIDELLKAIAADPRPLPEAPPYPNKARPE